MISINHLNGRTPQTRKPNPRCPVNLSSEVSDALSQEIVCSIAMFSGVTISRVAEVEMLLARIAAGEYNSKGLHILPESNQ